MKKAIIIFTRVPEAGHTKTRMMPVLNPKECAKLHTCFLYDIKNVCRAVDADMVVCYTPQGKQKALYPIFGTEERYVPQEGKGLGERMYRAVKQVLEKGYERCVLIGTDVPEIRGDCLEEAFEVLDTKDMVFGPAKDGGYYLVGMKEADEKVFENQSYDRGKVLENTVAGIRDRGKTVGFTRQLCDMDTPSDLWEYRKRMRGNRRLQQTATGKYLMRTTRISIIIPVYNEEKGIKGLQKQLWTLRGKCEIIFVDGGSRDRTLELIRPEFQVIHSEKGRANQMNAGAKASTGDILFFLHCDSQLPKRPLAEIRFVMKDYRVGCFGIAFRSANFFMFTCRVISNHRIKDRKVMFGDQGIFIDRELFFDVGMFPALPIMEDYQFSLTLKERGERLGMTKHRIYTSDRRFPKGTIPKLRLMWKMNRMRKMYRDGVPAERLAAVYRDIR